MTLASPTAPAETSSSPGNWLRVPAAAKRLGLSDRQLYRLVERRLVPFRRPPGTSVIAFDEEDIAEIKRLSAVRPLSDA